MRIFKILKHDVHDHYIVIAIFVVVVSGIYINFKFVETGNCHVLQPNIDCTQRGTITRDNVTGNNADRFVFIPAIYSYYHLDEYREKAQYGNMHAEFQSGSNTGTYHHDTFNAVVSPTNILGVISHISDNVSTSCFEASVSNGNDNCFGLPDYITVIVIWAMIISLPYYICKELYIHRQKIKKMF